MAAFTTRGKIFAFSAGLCAVALLALWRSPDVISAVTSKDRPNVVLIVADTLRADAIVDGEGNPLHPGLRSLAEDGVLFERAFSHAPMTLPSHAALFSSRFPFESGVLKNGDDVPAELPLLAEELNRHGYATAAIFSIGALGTRGDAKLARGFEQRVFPNGPIAWAEQTTPLVSETLDALAGDEPLFLFAHYADPHYPYRDHGGEERDAQVFLDGEPLTVLSTAMSKVWETTLDLEPGKHTFEFESEEPFDVMAFRVFSRRARVKNSFVPKSLHNRTESSIDVEIEAEGAVPTTVKIWLTDNPDRDEFVARYHREVAHFDRFLEGLLYELKQRDLYDSSLIVFTSDHGEGLWEHDSLGHSTNLYDELLNVPLIVKLPAGHAGAEALAERKADLVRHLDLAPTILETVELPPLRGHRGVSLFHDAERLLVAETHKPYADSDLVCIRDDRYKMIYDADEDRFALFDVVTDPDELVDLYAEKSGERPKWPPMLRSIADAAVARNQALELDEDVSQSLAALGYVAQ